MNDLPLSERLTELQEPMAPHFQAAELTDEHIDGVLPSEQLLLLCFVEAAGEPDRAVALVKQVRERANARSGYRIHNHYYGQACLAGLRAAGEEHVPYDELSEAISRLNATEFRTYVAMRLSGVRRADLEAWRDQNLSDISRALRTATIEEVREACEAGISLVAYANARQHWTHQQILSVPADGVSVFAWMTPHGCPFERAASLINSGLTVDAWRALTRDGKLNPDLDELAAALHAGLKDIRLLRYAELRAYGRYPMSSANAIRLALTAHDTTLVTLELTQADGVPGDTLAELIDANPDADRPTLRRLFAEELDALMD